MKLSKNNVLAAFIIICLVFLTAFGNLIPLVRQLGVKFPLEKVSKATVDFVIDTEADDAYTSHKKNVFYKSRKIEKLKNMEASKFLSHYFAQNFYEPNYQSVADVRVGNYYIGKHSIGFAVIDKRLVDDKYCAEIYTTPDSGKTWNLLYEYSSEEPAHFAVVENNLLVAKVDLKTDEAVLQSYRISKNKAKLIRTTKLDEIIDFKSTDRQKHCPATPVIISYHDESISIAWIKKGSNKEKPIFEGSFDKNAKLINEKTKDKD